MKIFNLNNNLKFICVTIFLVFAFVPNSKAEETINTLWRAFYYCSGFNECLNILDRLESKLDINQKEELDYVKYEKASLLSKSDKEKDILNAEKILLEIINDKSLKENPNNIFYYSHVNLGWMYHTEIAVFNPKKAIQLMTVAAEQNIPTAINNLGAFYEMGIGAKRDYEKSLELYLKASKMGNHWAHGNVAQFYILGLGGAGKNYNKAINHLKLATISQYGANDNYFLKILLSKQTLPKDKNQFIDWMKQEIKNTKDQNSFKRLGFEHHYEKDSFFWFYLCSEFSDSKDDVQRCKQELKILKKLIPNQLTSNEIKLIKENALEWYNIEFKEPT